jgi:hypothetical protein
MRSVIAAVFIGLLVGCASQRIAKEEAQGLAAFGTSAPAGTIALNDSMYYDQREITNLSWLEYEFWVMRVFGRGSLEHLAVLPDTSVWLARVSYGEPYRGSYLRHPAYNHFPVVGITQDQAQTYSKWRSDRVMEYYLFRAGVISLRPDQTVENHFTIERFYGTDSLKAYHHLPYPSYTLPAYSEWLLATVLSDSLAHLNLKRCQKFRTQEFRGAKFTECSSLVDQGRFIINSQERGGSSPADPIEATSCSRCQGDLIWHIRGNVAELSSDSTLVLGGGWTDPLASILRDEVFPSQAPNANTGFRNVCGWRIWDGARR